MEFYGNCKQSIHGNFVLEFFKEWFKIGESDMVYEITCISCEIRYPTKHIRQINGLNNFLKLNCLLILCDIWMNKIVWMKIAWEVLHLEKTLISHELWTLSFLLNLYGIIR